MNTDLQFHLKRILVPVDFSEPSRQALDYAASMARPFKAQIRLLHVVETVVLPPDVLVVDEALLAARLNEESAKTLDDWANQIGREMCVVEVLRAGSPYREIIEVAEQSDVDLIILGTHGRTGLSRLVIGSTAERVVRHAPCPALVVRQRKHPPHERHSACQETNARRKNQRNATAPSA